MSRQIIVGDVAILRAAGCDIIATARGYMAPREAGRGRYIGKIACQHSSGDMVLELNAMVDAGAEILNVIVEHELYGEITGQLNLSTRMEVQSFMEKTAASGARLLSELTGGVHLHTVACKNAEEFEKIRQNLLQQGFLYQGM